MTYWKLPSLLLINASFFDGLEESMREGNKEKDNSCLIQGHLVASCKALRLPPGICLSIGHPVTDELSLFSFKITQRKQATASTHPLLFTDQSAHSSCPASFSPRNLQLPQELLCRNLCLCPSFPNLWPHTLVHLWQAAAASWPQPSLPAPPHPLHRPETSVCCEANEQESWGNFRVHRWNRTRGPPQKSYIRVRTLDRRSHEEHNSLLQMHAEPLNREHACYFTFMHVTSV